MNVRKYTGRDAREAMAQVRAELGADAYILANRRVGGLVELTVACNLDGLMQEAAAAPATAPPANSASEIQLKALERELTRLRGILESELGERSWRDATGPAAPATALRQRLLRLGLSRQLVGGLMQRLPADASLDAGWRLCLAQLRDRLGTDPLPETGAAVRALYGGTGVGKTSTIAKLAGRDVRRFGSERVGLITLDGYRIGAIEQLVSFADALGVRLLGASNAHDLSLALREFQGRRVYIDTAGMSQHDPRLVSQRALVERSCPQAAHILVLAASTHAAQNRALLTAFGSGAFCGAIISKVDEAQSLGGVIDVLVQGRLGLLGSCNGQRVPQDIRDPDAGELIEEAVARVSVERPATVATRAARGPARVVRARA
jgi:flagellar biosynthesis protein FlhF